MFGVAKIVQGESKEKQKPQDFDFSLPSRRLSSRSRVVQGESKEKQKPCKVREKAIKNISFLKCLFRTAAGFM